jgi:hypothetical protein
MREAFNFFLVGRGRGVPTLKRRRTHRRSHSLARDGQINRRSASAAAVIATVTAASFADRDYGRVDSERMPAWRGERGAPAAAGGYGGGAKRRRREPHGRKLTMSEKEGTLRVKLSGRWAICRPDRSPILELTSGDVFRVEVAGELELRVTRMGFRHYGRGGEYYSVDGYPLRDGLRAAFVE